MGLSQGICMVQGISHKLTQSIGEFLGDIPLYSLHRIKSLMRKKKIGISKESEALLRRHLLVANEKYKTESGNNWSCLTSINLIEAIESLNKELKETVDSVLIGQPAELLETVHKIISSLHRTREEHVSKIKQWFVDHGDKILYDTTSKIPWAVVRRLRLGLSHWAIGTANPFKEEIETAILQIAKDEGIEAEDSEEAWIKMGGQLFK